MKHLKFKIALNIVLPNFIIIASFVSLFIYGWYNPSRDYYIIISFSLALLTIIAYLVLVVLLYLSFKDSKEEN